MMRPLVRVLMVLAPLFVLGAIALAEGSDTAEQRGDAAWQERTRGFAETGQLYAEAIQVAVLRYEQALAEDPLDLELHFKLMDALYYKGFFLSEKKKAKKRVFDRSMEVSKSALDILYAVTGGEEQLKGMSVEEQATLFAEIPDAAGVHFWAAVNWGLWVTAHGNISAARKNGAAKLRDHAKLVILLDDQLWHGGGYRLLGRLYTKAPIVPIYSSWVDRTAGMKLLRSANAVSAKDPRNPLFLAEAILKFESDNEDEAIALLTELSRRSPGAERPVEDAHYIAEARRLLDEVLKRRAKREGKKKEAEEDTRSIE